MCLIIVLLTLIVQRASEKPLLVYRAMCVHIRANNDSQFRLSPGNYVESKWFYLYSSRANHL